MVNSLRRLVIKSYVRLFYHLSGAILLGYSTMVYHCFFPLLLPDSKNISYEELKALLGKSKNLLLVDVRGKEEVDKGHIPGSVHMPSELLLN